MSKKRGRDDDENDARARAPVKVDEVTRAVMRIVSAWRDACGSEYQVRARIETSQDASVLRIGSFDELACERIVAVLDADLPGDYSITESQCDMNKKGLVLVIRRSWAGGAIAAKEARTENAGADGAGPSGGGGGGGGVSSDFVRLRISNIIQDKTDAERVVAIMCSVMKHLPSGTAWTVSSSPACHVVSFKLTDAKLNTDAVRAACVSSDSASAVDFERGALRVSVPKAHPEIV